MLNTEDNKANIVVTFTSDVILLAIMLSGLLILRRESGVTFPLGRLLWTQVESERPSFGAVLLNPLTFSLNFRVSFGL